MTDITGESMQAARAGAENAPFERWVDAARPKARLWRLAIGVVIVLTAWIAWTALVMFAYAVLIIASGTVTSAQTAIEHLVDGTTPWAILALLITFLGLWFGVALATALMHRQKFWTVVSPEGRVRWREFGIGVAIIAGYAAASSIIGLLLGMPQPTRSGLSLAEWAALAAPVCVVVFFQSSGEELLFRGYLTQTLAARFRNPLIWGLLPALAFGLMHYSNGTFAEYSAYYALATGLFALTATVTVWRTGSISMAMGMHTANNVVSFLVFGASDGMNATQLWVYDVNDVVKGAPLDIAMLGLTLAFVLSPWAPMPKLQPFARRNETRAAP